jgi:hypothetical protein
MHRKFIALIIATAVAITGISASQARAADTRDILGGLAAIALIGAAVNHYHQEKKRDEEAERRKRHKQAEAKAKKAKKKHAVRPLPKRVARYDLPQRCLRTFNAYSNKRPLLGPNCLKKYYKHADSLPHQCKVGFWNGKKVKRAYEPACLRQKGYRVVYQ